MEDFLFPRRRGRNRASPKDLRQSIPCARLSIKQLGETKGSTDDARKEKSTSELSEKKNVVSYTLKLVVHMPICSMYGIFTNICPKNHPNVRKITIHGASGISNVLYTTSCSYYVRGLRIL